ncbi:MAG: PQQ-binding-like beta-propeller repeat protein, partial [Pirellulales bacterium]|nr:PQQ-binding-like beta-propeller repeat protein [Pirellulales bacterium]
MRSFNRRAALQARQLMQRWFCGAAIAAGDTLLVTPVESERLFGLDLLTGEFRFAEKNRVNMRYLAGARDGKFFVVGANQMRAYDLQTGASVWTSPRDMLAAGQQISGCGVFGDGDYLIPTNSNQLIRVSLEDGSVLERRHTRFPLSNLVVAGGQLIAQSESQLTVAYCEAALEPYVRELLAKDPNNFEALIRKSELLIQRGKRREALELLARARAIDPINDEVHLLSISAMLGELRDNLEVDGELVETLDQLVESPTERAELLALRIRAALEQQKYVQAGELVVELSKRIALHSNMEDAAAQVVNDVTRYCSLDSWLAARANEIATHADADQLESINELIRVSSQPQLQGSKPLLARMVSQFYALAGVDSIRDELGQRLAKSAANFQRERLALGLQPAGASGLVKLSDKRLLMLGQAYVERKLNPDALQVVEELKTRQAADLESQIGQLEEEAHKTSGRHLWPEYVSLTWETQQPMRPRSFSTQTRRFALAKATMSESFKYWRLVSEGSNRLAMSDPSGLLRPVSLDGLDLSSDDDKETHVSGSFMAIVMPNAIVGVDLYHVLKGTGEAKLWLRPIGDSGSTVKRQSETTPFGDQLVRYYLPSSSLKLSEFRMGPILGDRLLTLQGGDLMALDLNLGNQLWRNSQAPKRGVVVANDRAVAVVSNESTIREVSLFDLFDGAKLESAPWEHGKIWATVGTNILCYSTINQSKRLYEIKLVDPFTNQVLLRCESHGSNRGSTAVPSAYGRIVGGRYM